MKNILAAKTKLAKEDKVLPGIEPGFGDSESPVITVTLQDRRIRSRRELLILVLRSELFLS